MTITLHKLVAKGINKPDAEIVFRPTSTLVRGPSDTGKSYIRDCLWYLLGGDKVPKEIPQAKGYTSLYLEFKSSDNSIYTISRSIFGGGVEIFLDQIQDIQESLPLPEDISELLVGLSGAKDKLLLRSLSKRGPMTGGDLRHWSLLSQPTMISEDVTTGVPTEQTQRKAAFSVFLTGQDDSSFVLAPTKDEKIKISTLTEIIDRDLARLLLEIPDLTPKEDIQDALLKIDCTLDVLSARHVERSSQLRDIRKSLNNVLHSLNDVESKLNQSLIMASRFKLLDEKYANDLSRLRAVSNGIAVFEKIDSFPCLLCGTPFDGKSDVDLVTSSAGNQRKAMEAEAKKIESLRHGLTEVLERENNIIKELTEKVSSLKIELEEISNLEKNAIYISNAEFSSDPKELAERRTEFVSLLKIFDEIERLQKERDNLKRRLPDKKIKSPIRHTDSDAILICAIVKEMLFSWGFTTIQSIDLVAEACDINIDGRPRLSYGAGKRAIFLSALIVALMQHAIEKEYPHLGVVVLDSPIKAYSDPVNSSDITVSPTIVRESFYSWLSNRNGPGQVIVLENEPVKDEVAKRLRPIVFTGIETEGRAGFYPTV